MSDIKSSVVRRVMATAMVATVLATAGVAVSTLRAGTLQGCCGVDHGTNCTLDAVLWTRCDSEDREAGDVACYEANENFPHCCDTGGWCGVQGS